MRTIGLVGGMTPESTVGYYQLLIRRCRERVQDPDPLRNPVVVVYSLDLAEVVACQRRGDPDGVAERVAAACEALRRAGAEFGALTANTPHLYFDAISARTALELVSIVEATALAAARRGLRRVLLLGTERTMSGAMYPARLAAAGVETVIPAAEDRAFVDAAIFGELAVGEVRPATRERLLAICARQLDAGAVDGVALACTELPLVIAQADLAVPVLDTAAIHVEAILDRALG